MYRVPANKVAFEEPFLLRHPWLAALLLGTVATPAAVILAVPAPRPLDAVLAWPLVLVDSWVGPGLNIGTAEEPIYEGTPVRLLALVIGIVLTWLFYILLARLALWRVAAGRAQGA
jgi:hypothetical protein